MAPRTRQHERITFNDLRFSKIKIPQILMSSWYIGENIIYSFTYSYTLFYWTWWVSVVKLLSVQPPPPHHHMITESTRRFNHWRSQRARMCGWKVQEMTIMCSYLSSLISSFKEHLSLKLCKPIHKLICGIFVLVSFLFENYRSLRCYYIFKYHLKSAKRWKTEKKSKRTQKGPYVTVMF